MKKIFAVIISAVLLFCCMLPVCAAGNYTYIAPAWLTFLGEDNGIKMWAAPDYSSLLMLLTSDNHNGNLISDYSSGQSFNAADFLGKDVSENFDIKSHSFKTVGGYECLSASCSVKPGHENGTFLVSSYRYNMYVFMSNETVYMFVFGNSASSPYNSLSFESTFKTFKINEKMTAATVMSPLPKIETETGTEAEDEISVDIITDAETEENDSGLVLYTEAPTEEAPAAADTGSKVSGIVRLLPVIAIVLLAAAVILIFVLRRTVKNEEGEEAQTEDSAAPAKTDFPQQPFEEETYQQFDLSSAKGHKRKHR